MTMPPTQSPLPRWKWLLQRYCRKAVMPSPADWDDRMARDWVVVDREKWEKIATLAGYR